MNCAILFPITSMILLLTKYLIGMQMKRIRDNDIPIIDLSFVSRIYSVCSVVFIIIFESVNILEVNTIKKNQVAAFFCEVGFVFLLLMIGLFFERYYWGFPISGIIRQPAFGRKREYNFEDIECYTIGTSNQVVLHMHGGDNVVIPILDNTMLNLVKDYLDIKQIKYKNRLSDGKVVMREGKARRIGSIVANCFGIIFLAGCFYYNINVVIILLGIIFVLGTFYDSISRHYNTFIIDGKRIVYKRFLRKTIDIRMSEIKTYCIKKVDNAEIIELATVDNFKLKVNMLWDNSYAINNYIKRYKWKPL